MAGIRGRQNSSVWQTWQGYYLPVLSWSSLTIYIFWSFTKKICLKKGEVWRKKVISTKLLSRLSRRFAVFFSLPSCCVSFLLSVWRCVLIPAHCAALRLPTFDQAPSLHPSTGEGFNQELATSRFPSLEVFSKNFQVCLSHPHLYSQPSFFNCND